MSPARAGGLAGGPSCTGSRPPADGTWSSGSCWSAVAPGPRLGEGGTPPELSQRSPAWRWQLPHSLPNASQHPRVSPLCWGSRTSDPRGRACWWEMWSALDPNHLILGPGDFMIPGNGSEHSGLGSGLQHGPVPVLHECGLVSAQHLWDSWCTHWWPCPWPSASPWADGNCISELGKSQTPPMATCQGSP